MLSINISELILTFASFYIMLVLMKKFLFVPLITFMDQRQERIDAGLQKGKEAEEKVLQVQQQYDDALRDAMERAASHVEKGRERSAHALKCAQDSLETAQQRAEDQKRQDRQMLLDRSGDELRQKTDELSRTLADRLLSR